MVNADAVVVVVVEGKAELEVEAAIKFVSETVAEVDEELVVVVGCCEEEGNPSSDPSVNF